MLTPWSVVFRYFPTIKEEWASIRAAMRMRGIHVSLEHIMVPLLMSNLDIQAIEKVRKILSLLKQQGKTIIIAEHRTYYLKELADRAIYMENGRIVREYSMEELEHLSREEQLHSGIRTVDLLSYPVMLHTAIFSNHEIALKDVHCSYDKTEALSIPELSLASGRITAIIGTNGAGKSTFVSWLCGLLKKAKGIFLLDGKMQRTRDRVQKSYLVMQEVNHQLFSDSVREEIMLGSSRRAEDSLQEIMALLDVSELAERHPMTLSGGEKQRVIIASACDSVVHIEHGRFLEQYTLDSAGIQKLKTFFTQYMRDIPET